MSVVYTGNLISTFVCLAIYMLPRLPPSIGNSPVDNLDEYGLLKSSCGAVGD